MSRVEVIGGKRVCFLGYTRLVTIYCIKAKPGAAPVYVGSTSQEPRIRLRAHIADARKGSALPIHEWLRGRSEFTVEILEIVRSEDRRQREQHWVAAYPGLLNITDGGPGMSGHRFAGTDHARRIGEKIRTSKKYVCESCAGEFHRKRSQAVKGNCRFCSRECYQRWQIGKPKPARIAA